MSRDKQIEEIAKLICTYPQCINYNEIGGCKVAECSTVDIAEAIYNAGYRKQDEGEWIIKSETYQLLDEVDEELFVECSICQRRFNVPYEFDDEKIFAYAREHYPYCNCGAKMKGGAE